MTHGGITWELCEVSDSQKGKKEIRHFILTCCLHTNSSLRLMKSFGAIPRKPVFSCLAICRRKNKEMWLFNPISLSPNLAGFDLTKFGTGCCLLANGSDLPREYFAVFFAYSAYWIYCPPRHFFQLQKTKTISLIAYLSAKLVAMTPAVFTLWHKNNVLFCTERNIQLNIFCLARQRKGCCFFLRFLLVDLRTLNVFLTWNSKLTLINGTLLF